MKALQMSVNLKPNLFEWIKMKAKQKQLSYSGYVARLIEKDMEENFVITKAEADCISQKTLADPHNKTYDNLTEFFSDLDHEVKKI